jgi:hypothetical protein
MIVPTAQAYVLSADEASTRVNEYHDTCRRYAKSIALGVVCDREELRCRRCADQRAPGCEFVSIS